MKKILSVMLAVLTLFSVLSIGASAAQLDYNENTLFNGSTAVAGTVISSTKHTILGFNFGGGTSKYALPVYDTSVGFVMTEGVGDRYLMLPGCKTGYYLEAGTYINVPYVKAPEGYEFNGWFCTINNEYYVANERIQIPAEWVGQLVEFEACYIPAEVEGDTMKTVLGVLTKVFGTILGILFLDGSSAAGIELVEKLLGGIM